MLLETDKPKFYGRRQGRKIRKAKTSLLDAFLPQIRITPQTVFDRQTMFGAPVDKVCLESDSATANTLPDKPCNIRIPVLSAPKFSKTGLPTC